MNPPLSTAPVATDILCRQCGAVLQVEQGSQFVVCEFCGTTNFIDKSQAILHYAVRPTVRDNDAVAALRRWMAGNATVKDLDKKAQVEQPEYQLFPMWMARITQNEQEKVFLEPAAALSVSELKQVTIPAADLEPFDSTATGEAIAPTVPYEAMLRWLADNHGVQRNQLREASLVHLPIYLFKYTFNGRRFTAVVDAATSKVFANIYPSKWEVPYLAIGSAGCLAYFCAALIPLVAFLSGEGTGLALGLLVYAVVAVLLAIPLFGVAVYVSAKV